MKQGGPYILPRAFPVKDRAITVMNIHIPQMEQWNSPFNFIFLPIIVPLKKSCTKPGMYKTFLQIRGIENIN